MSNDFIKIYDDLYNKQYQGKDKIDCICKELDNEKTFSNLDSAASEKLPAFAAWIAEKMTITSTQLRRFYTYVKSIERTANDDTNGNLDSSTKNKLMFLLPKLAGNEQKGQGIKELHRIFSICIYKNKKIRTLKDLNLFIEFFEAVLDYHSTMQK